MAEDNKNPKEASNIFYSIIKASVKTNNPTELQKLLKDEESLMADIVYAESQLQQLRDDLITVREKIKNLRK